VPSQRCPDCGRFLPRGFVASLADRRAPCPRCGVELDGARLASDDATTAEEPAVQQPAVPRPVAQEPGAQEPGAQDPERELLVTSAPAPAGVDDRPADASVRPPDLAPDTVRDDVLAGWDVGVGPTQMTRWREDRRPFPTDTVVVAGAAAAGLVVGAVLDDRHGRGAAIGTVVGGVAGAAARRIWRLDS
jgi:hypothetical protein